MRPSKGLPKRVLTTSTNMAMITVLHRTSLATSISTRLAKREVACSSAAMGRCPIDQMSLLAIDGFVAPVSAITEAELRIARAEYSDSQDLAPPSRLHLLHQILLI